MASMLEIPVEELPYWMRQARRGWDWGLLLVLLLCLTAAWPFIVRPGLPRTNASENYVFMTKDYAAALRDGQLYPRWSPNVFNGYGAPIPNYYPPLAVYTAAVIDVLFSNDPVVAVRVVYILSFCVAGLSIYLLVNRHAGAGAGFTAALLLLFSPYLALVAPHIQGDLPGMAAMALFPCLLWLADRLLSDNQPLNFLWTAAAAAVLLLTEPRVFAVSLLLLVGLAAYYRWKKGRGAALVSLAAALVAAVGLSAFYWLPAWVERDLVRWTTGLLHSNLYLTLADLMSPLRPVDLIDMLPVPQMTLGLVTPIFGLGACLALVLRRRGAGFHALMLLVGAAAAAWGIYVMPEETWLMGPLVICLAAGGSGAVALGQRLGTTVRRLGLALSFLIAAAASYPAWLAPQWSPSFGEVTPLQQLIYEQQGYGTAVLPASAPVPTTLPESLPPNRLLVAGYQAGIINKLAQQSARNDVELNLLKHGSQSDHFQIGLNAPTQLTVLTAYFPGWSAYLNERSIGLSQDRQSGLMVVDVPPGRGVLSFNLEDTPARQYAWIIAGLSLALALAATGFRLRAPKTIPAEPDMLQTPTVRLLGITLVGFMLSLVVFAAAASPFNLYPRLGSGLDGALSLRSRTETGLEALAYRIERTHYRPGDTVDFTIYWQAVLRLSENYRVQVHLYDRERDIRWHRTDFLPPGDYPTQRWLTYRYVRDAYQLPLSDSISPGEYWLTLEVYTCRPDCESSPRLTFFDARGQNLGQEMTLPTPIFIAR